MEQTRKLIEAGHRYIDLGLSVKWATCNVGARGIYEYGNYYAWGDVIPHYDSESFKLDNYKFRYKEPGNGLYKLSKYNTDANLGHVDNLTWLEPMDDVAQLNWRGRWRMPSVVEIRELIDNCSCEWYEHIEDGEMLISGYCFTSKVKGHETDSIFLPGDGLMYEHFDGSYSDDGFYWTADLCDRLPGHCDQAYCLRLEQVINGTTKARITRAPRYGGTQIRPVFE